MNGKSFWLNIILFVAFLLVQVLLCNHILLFGVAMPFLYIYYILSRPVYFNRDLLMALSFLMGFLLDICVDTPGVNALACTIMAMLRRPILFAYVMHDDKSDELIPSIYTLPPFSYIKYVLSFTAIFCLIVFSTEYFSIANVKDILILTASSTLLTSLLVIGLDSILNFRSE